MDRLISVNKNKSFVLCLHIFLLQKSFSYNLLFSFIEFSVLIYLCVLVRVYLHGLNCENMPCKNADTLNQSKTKFYSLELIIAYSRLNDRNITKQIMKSRQAGFENMYYMQLQKFYFKAGITIYQP